LKRASAFLQQAQSHKEALETAISGEVTNLPSTEMLQLLLSEAISPFSSSVSVASSSSQESENIDDKSDYDDNNIALKTENNETSDTMSEISLQNDKITMDNSSQDDKQESNDSFSTQSFDENEVGKEARKSDPQTAFRLSALRKLQNNGNACKIQLRSIRYRHGLYQNSLLQATRDSLRSTEVLPSYPTTWLRAGEVLSDLWKIKESKQYYEKALSLDDSLKERLEPILRELELRQEMIDRTRANKEWPEDSLQLALDITG